MDLQQLQFHRLFSKTIFKDLSLPLWEMTFTKDFVTDNKGDLYPVLKKSQDCREGVEHNRFRVQTGSVSRLAGSFFPYATYEVTFTATAGNCGFSFILPEVTASIIWQQNTVVFTCGNDQQSIPCSEADGEVTLLITCRPGAFDVYRKENGKPAIVQSFISASFADTSAQKTFQSSYVALIMEGDMTVLSAKSYMDCGISQADMRPIRYENGDVMVENGKIYLTVSCRMEQDGYQGILAWTPGTSHFEQTGALFYDSGDGKWCGDVAASLLYDRKAAEWKLWVCSFAHNHILGHAAFQGDVRFGVNVVDITLMETAAPGTPVTEFAGFEGDEDPDFFFEETENKWYMAICRLDPVRQQYRYMFFRSDRPFDGYVCIGSGMDGAETGGSFVKIGNERVFACGNDFEKRADYRIYTKDGMVQPSFDYDDGGFRGWGTIIPVQLGSRKRYFWLTFDRSGGSSYPWSYGNWYGFELID